MIRKGSTHSNAGGDKIALVQDEEQVLVGSLLTNVLFDTSATSTERISGVEDVDDNITGIDDLVQLVPDSLTLTLGEDGLLGGRGLTMNLWGSLADLLSLVGVSAQETCLFEAVKVRVVHLVCLSSKILQRANSQLWTLSLSLGAESVCKGRSLNGNLGLVLLDAVLGVLIVLDQTHGKLVLLEEVRVRIVLGLGNGTTEGSKSILGNDTSICEPLPVGLDTGVG